MIKLDLDINIYRPLQEVFVFVATPENDFHWQYGTLMSARISDGEMAIGTLFRAVGHFMGRRMESVYEVTDFEYNKRYGFKSHPGSLGMYTLYTFEVIKGSTRINLFAQLDPADALKGSNAATEKSTRKQYRENLALLKDILETRQAAKQSDPMRIVSGHER